MIRALLAALLLLNLLPARAAEPYRPDAALVEAARKEGQALWYTTLIVDQIVRPLIRAFQAQVPGVEIKIVRIDSGQQVVRLINEAKVSRVQADVWSVIDGVAPLSHGNVAAPFDIASARGLPPTLVDPGRRIVDFVELGRTTIFYDDSPDHRGTYAAIARANPAYSPPCSTITGVKIGRYFQPASERHTFVLNRRMRQ